MVIDTIWTDADFDLAYGQLVKKYGVQISFSDVKARNNTKSILGTGDHIENIQHEYNTSPSECQSNQFDGNGNSLSILEPTHDLVDLEITRNKQDSYSERAPIDPDGATQYTGHDTIKDTVLDEPICITKLEKFKQTKSDYGRPCGRKLQGLFIPCKDECHVTRSREPTGRRHGQDGFEILEKGWHVHGNRGSRIPKASDCWNCQTVGHLRKDCQPRQHVRCKQPTYKKKTDNVRPTKNRNGRHPKQYKWNGESQQYVSSYWEGLTHNKYDKSRDKFGCQLKQSTKKAKKVECPFDLKEMKEFFKCRADFEQAKKTLSSVQW
jgi:hypothetical protein